MKPGTSTRKPPSVSTKTPDFIVHSSKIDPVENCDASITKYNNGIRACKGQPIFSEDFNELDSSKWTPEVKFAGEPVSPFYKMSTSHFVNMQHKENSKNTDFH